MDEPVHGGERHGGIREDPVPFAKGLVGGDQQRPSLVACADQLEEHRRLGLVARDVGKVVENEQVVFVELGHRRFECEFAPGDLQALHEVGSSGEQNPPAPFHQCEADCRGKMAFTTARRTEQDEVGALLEPAIAGAQGHDLGLGDHRHGIEGEAVQGLACGQMGLCQVAFDPAAIAFGEFVLGERGEEPAGGPSLLVRLGGEVSPDVLDGGQAQFVEHEAEALCIDHGSCAHAASPCSISPS